MKQWGLFEGDALGDEGGDLLGDWLGLFEGIESEMHLAIGLVSKM